MQSGWEAVQEQLQQAFHFQRAGRLSEAEELCQRIVSARPDLAEAKVRYMRGNLEEAAKAYRQSVALQSSHAAYNNLGNALFMLGRMQEAEDAYLKAAAAEPA